MSEELRNKINRNEKIIKEISFNDSIEELKYQSTIIWAKNFNNRIEKLKVKDQNEGISKISTLLDNSYYKYISNETIKAR